MVILKKFAVRSFVTDHTATTKIYSDLYNPSPVPEKFQMTFALPDDAILADMNVTLPGKTYTSSLQGKEKSEVLLPSPVTGSEPDTLLKADLSREGQLVLQANLRGFGEMNVSWAYEEFLQLNDETRSQAFNIVTTLPAEALHLDFFVKLTPVEQNITSLQIQDCGEAGFLNKSGRTQKEKNDQLGRVVFKDTNGQNRKASGTEAHWESFKLVYTTNKT